MDGFNRQLTKNMPSLHKIFNTQAVNTTRKWMKRNFYRIWSGWQVKVSWTFFIHSSPFILHASRSLTISLGWVCIYYLIAFYVLSTTMTTTTHDMARIHGHLKPFLLLLLQCVVLKSRFYFYFCTKYIRVIVWSVVSWEHSNN